MAAKKTSRVRVTATRNMDFMNEGEVTELDRDDRISALIEGGYLRELGKDEDPAAGPQVVVVPLEGSTQTRNVAAETEVSGLSEDAGTKTR